MNADTRPATRLDAEHLAFTHAGPPVFAGLSFSIGPGLTLVRGGDGRGKSTLLRLLAGTLAPTAGQLRRTAASVFLEQPEDTVHDAVVARDWLVARRAGYPGWQGARAEALVADFGLAEHLDKPLFMLSTGSRRKVGLVAAAASGAALTLLDLPFAALDAASRRVLAAVLAEAATAADGRAWVVADYAQPEALAEVRWAGVVDLGD